MDNHRERVDIALCFNDAYVKHIGPLVYALSKNNEDLDLILHVVYKNLTDDSLATLTWIASFFDNITFDFRYIESDLINQVAVEHSDFPLETYFRLVLSDVLHDVDRLIYFDVDLLISGSIRGLWEWDLQGSCIAGAIEKDNYMYFPGHAEWLGLTEEHGYFSAGVLLFDLKQMRERNLTEILVHQAIEKATVLPYCDQDLLNMYFKDEVVHFDNRYNYSSWQMFNEDNEPDNVSITHFNGQQKPWGVITEHRGHQWQFTARYRQYRREFSLLTNPEQARVSILVDARQTPEYLETCLESVFSQAYQNIEIIVIVDPSDHPSMEKVTQQQHYYPNLVVISSERISDSALELLHAEEITGDFVTGLVSADFLTHYYVDALIDLHQKYKTDIVVGDYYELDATDGVFYIRNTNTGEHYPISKHDVLSNGHECHLTTLSGKLFTKEFLNRIELTEEDKALELNLLRNLYLNSHGIAYVKSHLFCHRNNLPTAFKQPSDLTAYEQQIKAIQRAIVDSLTLGIDTQPLVDRLTTLLKEIPYAHEELSSDTRHLLNLFNQTKN